MKISATDAKVAVDTSALMAVILNEAEAERCSKVLEAGKNRAEFRSDVG